jgi:UDP-N-acetylglucosamine 4,6-dehydratase/5-epimerase
MESWKKEITNADLKKLLKNKMILLTGGAGSISSELVIKLLEFPIKGIRVLDINEHSLFQLKRKVDDPRLRLLLGDILNKERLELAGAQIDIVCHLAAIKNIEISEFNPIETIDVNVNGMVNLIKMITRNKPKIVLNISTDKAANASTLYGMTKKLSEKLTSWAGNHIEGTKFASIRFGNVMETRGNVFEIWKEESENNIPLSITDPKMMRYFFHVEEAVHFILKCMFLAESGEIFVPKMKKYNIKKLAMKYSKKHKIIGLRPGEKHEEILIADDEKDKSIELKNMWVIKPSKF